MPPVEGRRWALVVFGPPLLLIGLAALAYTGLFLVPGGPCHGSGELTAPQSTIEIAANDSAVTAIRVGGDDLGGDTTDRVALAVRDSDTGSAASTPWAVADGERSVTLTERAAGFTFSDDDVVRVRWYGVDPNVAGFCPNGRTVRTIAASTVGNASVPIET